MFTSHAVKSLLDLSLDLSDQSDWDTGLLRTVGYHLDITAVTTEPVSGLFAVGTARGIIHIYGSPAVDCQLKLTDPSGLRIKFLQFAASAFRLLCIDEHDRFFVWDLTGTPRPKLQKIIGFGQPVNAIATSPSHTHAFIALGNGDIKTYDLLCLRTSQYVIPNLWTIYEERSLVRGSPGADSPTSDMIIDLVIHPRDLNLLFVAYEGGVILADLKEQGPVRSFELILSPGAPGGTGYHAKNILLPRRLQVTALAVHPSGHLLAIGYADGTIGFWSLDDEDRPLLLRTVDSSEGEDLSLVDTAMLDAVLSAPQQHPPEPPREPVFKLAWSGFPNSSDPRGGDTVLTVLGGLMIDSIPGVTSLLLPPLQPPAPPNPSSPKGQVINQGLHPETRDAMCLSLSVKNAHTYNTAGPVQDFLLFPRSSPHFCGAYDPSTILIVSDSDVPEARVCEAFDFPPPPFVDQCLPETASPADAPVNAEGGAQPDDALAAELARTLHSMSMSDDPRPARLPQSLWTVLREYLVKVDKNAYETLVRDKLQPVEGEVSFPVKGGMAWAEDMEGYMKHAKQQPHRILIASLRDLSIRFLDVSAILLVSTGPDNPLASSFPSPIHRLTIELAPILVDRSLGLSGSGAKEYDPRLTKERIDAVYFAPESLECVTVLRSQAVVLHRLDVNSQETSFGQQVLEDDELVSLSHLRVRNGLRYSPVFAVKPDTRRGPVTACALSDIGFLAIAYTSGFLMIIDLRGPRVLLRKDSQPTGGAGFLHRYAEHEPIHSLSWTCCGLSTDPEIRVRLLCATASGQTTIYTLEYKIPSTWAVTETPATVDGSVRPVSGGSVVLDAKTGAWCNADQKGLSTVLQANDRASDGDRKFMWISAGAKGARTMLNVNGERIAKVDWGSKVGTVQHVQVVTRLDSCALVAYTSLGLGLIYSLPHLEHIHTLQLQISAMTDLPSTDDRGDYLTHTTFPVPAGSPFRPVLSTEMHTLFPSRRAGPYAPPLVDLTYGRGTVPPQPQPVSLGPASVMSSVLGYIGSLAGASAGDQIDALLAGPDRPIPAAAVKPAPPRSPLSGGSDSASMTAESVQSSISARAAGMSSGVGDLYSRLGNALAERGEMLGDLQQSMDSLEQGSKNMVAQAKSLAAKQTMKSWFPF